MHEGDAFKANKGASVAVKYHIPVNTNEIPICKKSFENDLGG